MEEEKTYGVKPKVKKTDTIKTEAYQVIFTLVTRNKETEIAVGNNIVSKIKFKSTKEAKNYIDSKPWELIVNTTCCIYDMSEKINKQNK